MVEEGVVLLREGRRWSRTVGVRSRRVVVAAAVEVGSCDGCFVGWETRIWRETSLVVGEEGRVDEGWRKEREDASTRMERKRHDEQNDEHSLVSTGPDADPGTATGAMKLASGQGGAYVVAGGTLELTVGTRDGSPICCTP